MKKKYKILSILTVVTLLISVITICAIGANAAQQGSATLGFTPPGEPSTKHNLYVSVEKNGSIFDGDQELSGAIIYELQVNQSKTFRVQPQAGYQLASVIFDNEDITNMVDANGMITIQGKQKDTLLVFKFKEEPSSGQPPSGGGGTSGGTDVTPQNDSSNSNDGGITQGQSSASTGGHAQGDSVKTGDTTSVTIAIAAMVMFLCGTVIIVFVRIGKRTNENHKNNKSE